jgi:hypothetical protein
MPEPANTAETNDADETTPASTEAIPHAANQNEPNERETAQAQGGGAQSRVGQVGKIDRFQSKGRCRRGS